MNIKPGLKVNETGFLFDPSTGESYSLNEMGVVYFNLITEGKTKEEIRSMILGDFEVDRISFEKSFIDFESRLKFLRLIKDEQ